MILVWLIGILIISGILALLLEKWHKNLARWLALSAFFIDFIITLSIWAKNYPVAEQANTWLLNYQQNWIPSFGITFHLAIDGLSLLLLSLTSFLGMLAVICSWNEISNRIAFFHFNLLWVIAGISGVFMAMDLFLFYFFWELMLIPMYFLIGIWGSENKVYAAYKFFIFTQASGLMMLIAIISLYFIHGQQTGNYTFSYFELLKTLTLPNISLWLFLGFMIAFAVKLPVVPFHTWLPDAHGEAPTAGSLILAGLLLKTGAYGILRFALPLFPKTAQELAPWALFFGVIGIIYGAVMAYSQTDIKRLIAYTSVSHMGFVIFGIFTFNELAMQGVVLQMLTHGISTGALFIMSGMLKERLHTRDINKMGGLWDGMPNMGALGLLFAMASLGLPGLGNFIAEFLTLLGAYKVNPLLTIIASLGLIFSAAYSLRLVQKVFLGVPNTITNQTSDFSCREFIIMTLLSLSIIGLGIYPQPFVNTTKPMITNLQKLFSNQDKTDLIRRVHSQTNFKAQNE